MSNITVWVRDNGLEAAIRKFTKKCELENISGDIRKYEFFESKTRRIRLKRKNAARKAKEKAAGDEK